GFENAERIAPELNGFARKSTDEMFFGSTLDKDAKVKVKETWEDWTRNKLMKPNVYDTDRVAHLMPTFTWRDPAEIEALFVFLQAQEGVKVAAPFGVPKADRRAAIDAGERLVAHYNCTGCHLIENQGGTVRASIEQAYLSPPNLLGVGKKVQ